jgi:ATP-dependent DNA helicase RecG
MRRADRLASIESNALNALDLLQSLNLLDENERIEAKRAQEAGKSLLESICAFANEPNLGGGWLLLGVTREELALFPGYEVEGVPNPDKLSADTSACFARGVGQCTDAS